MIVIDYRQLVDKIENPPYTLYSTGDRAAWLDECIATVHTFDAEPVKHGQWIRSDDNYWLTCSLCNTDVDVSCGAPFIYVYNNYITHINFCPNCGAKMDLKDGDIITALNLKNPIGITVADMPEIEVKDD